MGEIDVTVRNEGTIWLFRPLTDAAKDWINENVGESLWWCDSLACEHRYAPDLLGGMQDDGLIVGVDYE
jgi:hypothetical protein